MILKHIQLSCNRLKTNVTTASFLFFLNLAFFIVWTVDLSALTSSSSPKNFMVHPYWQPIILHTEQLISVNPFKKSKQTLYVRRSALFDEWNFAEYTWTRQKVIPFYSNGTPALNKVIEKNTRLRIQKVTPTHVQVTRGNLWILRQSLMIFPNHWGHFVSKHKTPLRGRPSMDSRIKGYLSSGLKLKSLGFRNGFVQIQWKGQTFFIPFHDVLSRLNFATQIKVNDTWQDILFVMGAWVKSTDGQFVPLNLIQGIKGGRSLGYVMASRTFLRSQPHAKAQVLLTLPQFTPVMLSKRVFKERLPSKSRSLRLITTDQLFERKVFDVASQNHFMWASASGIFRSFDGNSWEKVVFFKNQDFPLAIAPSGKLYVGPYKSIDRGKTFQQYIRWDLVFDALKEGGISAVSHLGIKDIEFLENNDQVLKMTVQIGRDGTQKAKLAHVISYNEGGSWHPYPQ